jgi:hypothetical protein
MKQSDQLATSFITPFGMYCYVTMPFGLRNAGATYQRCMQHVFRDHIGRTVEAYVDDIVVNTWKADDLVSDLGIAFGCTLPPARWTDATGTLPGWAEENSPRTGLRPSGRMAKSPKKIGREKWESK